MKKCGRDGRTTRRGGKNISHPYELECPFGRLTAAVLTEPEPRNPEQDQQTRGDGDPRPVLDGCDDQEQAHETEDDRGHRESGGPVGSRGRPIPEPENDDRNAGREVEEVDRSCCVHHGVDKRAEDLLTKINKIDAVKVQQLV